MDRLTDLVDGRRREQHVADRAITVAAWESLFRAQVTILRALAAEFPSEVLSLNEYDVLFNITRAPGRRLRLKDLNRAVLITQPSVSRLVDRLAARGLVSKMHDPDDGRGTIVSITPEGFDLFRRVAFTHMDAIDRHVGHSLDEGELRQLIELCDRLRLSVGEAQADAAPADAAPADTSDAGARTPA
jgi:DNA-binding MarR family transcriptional regulator